MRDPVTLSFFAGTIGYAFRFTLNHLLYYTGISPFLYRVVAADLFIPYEKAHSVAGFILGFMADWVGVVWVALAIALIIKYSGWKYYIIKGALVGASSWLLVFGFLVESGALGVLNPENHVWGLTSFALDTAMGTVTAFALFYLAKKTLIDSK